jgi:hypothetical protein
MKLRASALALLGLAVAACALTAGGCCERNEKPDGGRGSETNLDANNEADDLLGEIALTGRKVLEIEEVAQRRLYWIRFIESLQKTKPDTVWFTAILVDGTRGLDALPVASPFREGKPSSRRVVRIILRGTIKGPFGDGGPALAERVEQVRRALETGVPFLRDVATAGFQQDSGGAAGAPAVARFEFTATLVTPGVEPLAQAHARPALDELRKWQVDTDTAYRALLEQLLVWWDAAAYEQDRTPVIFLGNLGQLGSRIRLYAHAEAVRFGNDAFHMRFEQPATVRRAGTVPVEMLKQKSVMSDILLLLIHSKVMSVDRLEWHGSAVAGGEFYDKYVLTVVVTCKYPQLASFLAKLATLSKTKVLPRWWSMKKEDTLELPCSFLVVESLSYVAEDAASAQKAERHWLREPIDSAMRDGAPPIAGRVPRFPTLHVAMTVAMIDFGPGIRGPLPHEEEALPAPQEKGGDAPVEPIDPRDLAERIRTLKAHLALQTVRPEFVLRDIASDPGQWLPRLDRAERQCESCGWIFPEEMVHCPYCFAWLENDDDKDGMPNDWEDKHENTDRYEADADKDYDGDNQRNLKEFLGGSDPDDRQSLPLSLRVKRIYNKAADVRFAGYVIRPGGAPDVIDPAFWEVQLNYGRGSQAAVVALEDAWHKYTLGPLEKIEGAGAAGGQPREQYALTIRRPGGEPIRLVMGQWVTVNTTCADLVISWDGRDSHEEFVGVTVGDTVKVDSRLREITAITDEGITVGTITVPLLPE